MNTYKIYKGLDGKSYVRVYFMEFIELENFKAGRDIYVDASIVSMEEIGEIQDPSAAAFL